MSATLLLSQGFESLVDEADFAIASAAGKWSADVRPKTVYAVHAIRRTDGGWRSIGLHNYLTGWRFVDHINGDGLDNRRGNLRPAKQATNARNVGLSASNTSGYKGVSWSEARGKWQAGIAADGKRTYLGRYDDPAEAARAYDAAAIRLHGEFARLNFPHCDAVAPQLCRLCRGRTRVPGTDHTCPRCDGAGVEPDTA